MQTSKNVIIVILVPLSTHVPFKSWIGYTIHSLLSDEVSAQV